jgi:hypothetical protein
MFIIFGSIRPQDLLLLPPFSKFFSKIMKKKDNLQFFCDTKILTLYDFFYVLELNFKPDIENHQKKGHAPLLLF